MVNAIPSKTPSLPHTQLSRHNLPLLLPLGGRIRPQDPAAPALRARAQPLAASVPAWAAQPQPPPSCRWSGDAAEVQPAHPASTEGYPYTLVVAHKTF